MSTLHFPNDKLDAASVYDENLGKTQAEINADGGGGSGALLPTGEDQTQEIVAKLTADGVCQLGKGDYYVSNIVMPADTMLCGAGEATKLHFVDGATGNMVTMGDRCSVSDISFYGAEHLDSSGNEISLDDAEKITLSDGSPNPNYVPVDGDFPGGRIENETAANMWTSGDVSVPAASKYVSVELQTPIPAGTYRIGVMVVRGDSNTKTSMIRIKNGAGNNIAQIYFDKNGRSIHYFTIEEAATSITFITTSSADELASEWQDIRITKVVNDKSGICWTGDNVNFGHVRGCRFYYFNVAGLYMLDTGTPVIKNLCISDCFFFKCNVGIYIRKNSEYNRIENCIFAWNYFGALNRGGNNYFTNCGFDKNIIGFQSDSAEGSNGGHGCISNCSFNHSGQNNDGNGIVVSNEENEIFTNCVIGYSNVLLKKASGTIISGCYIGGTITVNGGNSNMIIGSYFHGSDSTVTAIDNEKTKLVNCYYFVGGGAVPLETETTS